MDEEIRRLIAHWGKLWGLPELASTLSVQYSTRLRRSLGRCRPATGRVTLSAGLREASPERRAQVLCHEVAHVAVHQLYGHAAKAHGPEWRHLVTRAGFIPEVRAIAPEPEPSSLSVPSSILPYEHRCPVCQSVRYARRPVRRWRCAECLEAGLGGELVISRYPSSTPAS